MKLDKSKPYGVIHGHHTAKYEQDGVLYDATYNSLIRPTITLNKEPKNGMEERSTAGKRK